VRGPARTRRRSFGVGTPCPGAISVRFELESGRVIEVSLQDIYDPPPASVDSVELYSFLIMQGLPPTMLKETMDSQIEARSTCFDAMWEHKVQARKRSNDEESLRQRKERGKSATPPTIGICDLCGQAVRPGEGFVNIGPTDWTDPSKPRSQQWVAPGTDIHGWSPFVVEHPGCFGNCLTLCYHDGMTRKTTTVRLPEELADQVDVVARGRGVSVNAVVVDALVAEVERVRADKTFMDHLRRITDRDKEILDRLAE
jgi:hypothetical protein